MPSTSMVISSFPERCTSIGLISLYFFGNPTLPYGPSRPLKNMTVKDIVRLDSKTGSTVHLLELGTEAWAAAGS